MQLVFVLDADRRPLDPVHPAEARVLLSTRVRTAEPETQPLDSSWVSNATIKSGGKDRSVLCLVVDLLVILIFGCWTKPRFGLPLKPEIVNSWKVAQRGYRRQRFLPWLKQGVSALKKDD